jgi:hypothetical protein
MWRAMIVLRGGIFAAALELGAALDVGAGVSELDDVVGVGFVAVVVAVALALTGALDAEAAATFGSLRTPNCGAPHATSTAETTSHATSAGRRIRDALAACPEVAC